MWRAPSDGEAVASARKSRGDRGDKPVEAHGEIRTARLGIDIEASELAINLC